MVQDIFSGKPIINSFTNILFTKLKKKGLHDLDKLSSNSKQKLKIYTKVACSWCPAGLIRGFFGYEAKAHLYEKLMCFPSLSCSCCNRH